MRLATARLLWLLMAHLWMLTLAAESTKTDDEAQSSVVTTLQHVASTMTSITVSWSDNSTKVTTGLAYQIKAHSLATDVRLISPLLSANETEYTLPDLAVNAKYELCLWSNVTVSELACAELSTIPVVRDDSLIALFIALAVIGAIILIAVILWRCAIRQASSADDNDTPSHVEDDDKQGLNEKSPLLVPATAETDQASPPPTDPANTPPDASNQEQPQSLYLFLAGHAFK